MRIVARASDAGQHAQAISGQRGNFGWIRAIIKPHATAPPSFRSTAVRPLRWAPDHGEQRRSVHDAGHGGDEWHSGCERRADGGYGVLDRVRGSGDRNANIEWTGDLRSCAVLGAATGHLRHRHGMCLCARRCQGRRVCAAWSVLQEQRHCTDRQHAALVGLSTRPSPASSVAPLDCVATVAAHCSRGTRRLCWRRHPRLARDCGAHGAFRHGSGKTSMGNICHQLRVVAHARNSARSRRPSAIATRRARLP